MIELRRGVVWYDGGRFIRIERYSPDRDFQHLLEVNFIVFPRRGVGVNAAPALRGGIEQMDFERLS
jgi:hypothetical protein